MLNYHYQPSFFRFSYYVLLTMFVMFSTINIAVAEEQNGEECRFAVKDIDSRAYGIYLPCSEILNFETNDRVISIRLDNLLSAIVTNNDKNQIKVTLALKDGRELADLRPGRLKIKGTLLIAETLIDCDMDMGWESLKEIKSLEWQKPHESDIWKSMEYPSYLKIQFKTNSPLFTSAGISAYLKGKYDTHLVYSFSPYSQIFVSNPIGGTIKVTDYNSNPLKQIFATSGPFTLFLPIERIAQLSQSREKAIVLKNSLKVPFDSVEIPGDLKFLGSEPNFGNLIFKLIDIELLEFAEAAPDYLSHLPEENFIYEIKDMSGKLYRPEDITFSFSILHDDLQMRFLNGKWRDNWDVAHGSLGDHIAYNDFAVHQANSIPVNFYGALLLLDLRYIDNIRFDKDKLFVELGNNLQFTASLNAKWDLRLNFFDSLTENWVDLSPAELVSLKRIDLPAQD